MDNAVWDSIPTSLQLSKRGIRKGHSVEAGDAFFWSQREEDIAHNIINTMFPNHLDDEGLIKNLERQLQRLYQTATSREAKFLKDIGVKLTPPTNVGDIAGNDAYASAFNSEVVKKIYNHSNSLVTLFQDIGYSSFLAHSPNIFSLTQAAEFASKNTGKKVNKNQAAYDLAKLFLSEEGQRTLSRTNGFRTVYLKDIFNKNGEINDNWFKQQEKFYNTYVGPGIGTEIYNSKECADIIKNEMINILDSGMSQMFENGSRRGFKFQKGTVGKGMSQEVEAALKTTFKKLTAQLIQTKKISMDFSSTYGGITLSGTAAIGDGFYDVNVNSKLWNKNGTLDNDKMVNILLEALESSIKLYAAGNKQYNVGVLIKQLKSNRGIIRDVIIKDLVGQKVDRTPEGVRKIIAKWGYAQTRGILGELAVALSISRNIKGSEVSVTGSNENKSGEVSMDVVAEINGSKYGFQVKNFKSLSQSNFYATDFAVKDERIMEKYFGEYADGYYWLFANEKMLYETDLIGANFKSQVEQSFYNFSDNFLRVSSGDAGPNFTYSDAFFIKDKIIPSSYMYCLLIKTVKNAKTNKVRFELQPETKQNQYQELQQGVSFTPVEVPNLINGMDARIEFKGINFNLNNI